MKTDTLGLDKLLPKSKKPATPASAPAKKAGDRVFPNDPLPLDGLKAVDARVLFDANNIIVEGIEITAVKVALNLKNGRLDVKPLAATVANWYVVKMLSVKG